MNAEAKDLRPIKAEELVAGGIFYKKNPDGSYSTCCFHAEEMKKNGNWILSMTKKYVKEGLLFVRINQPWKSFLKHL